MSVVLKAPHKQRANIVNPSIRQGAIHSGRLYTFCRPLLHLPRKHFPYYCSSGSAKKQKPLHSCRGSKNVLEGYLQNTSIKFDISFSSYGVNCNTENLFLIQTQISAHRTLPHRGRKLQPPHSSAKSHNYRFNSPLKNKNRSKINSF